MTNVGAWDRHYVGLTRPTPYGDSITYRAIADYVRGHGPVEDWGCGGGWLRNLVETHDDYVGVDGSHTPYADVVCDLVTYRSECGAVVLRHVLEHNHEWRAILDNALASASDRVCIVLFTPLADETHVLMTEPQYGDVPVISFALADLTSVIGAAGFEMEVHTYESPETYYGAETIVRAWR